MTGPATDSSALQRAHRLLALTPSQLPLAEQLVVAGSYPVNILLTGEAGTGKSRIARFIHEVSGAPADRLVVLSCTGIVHKLLEDETRGPVARVFCGTTPAEPGAWGGGPGTLVLDEIDLLDAEQQAAILRLLEANAQARAGDTLGPRIIATSRRNLKKEAQCGRFRTDLYFHLSVLTFHLPPLRERTGDILPLARNIIARYSDQFRKPPGEISPEALQALEAYSWPGNIRELENALQQTVLLNAEPVVLLRHLPKAIQGRSADLGEATEQSKIYRVLGKHGYNYTRAAQELGISRVWLYKKLKKYGIVRQPRPLTVDR
jgi:DNA-binding NtrC family response regulator